MIFDRIAFATDDLVAADSWAHDSGAGLVAWTEDEFLHARQYEFAGGGRMEFIAPRPRAGDMSPIRRFLDRNTPRLHHLTIRVDDFDAAVRRIRRRGLPVGRIQSRGPTWREGYLAPADTGNILVQIGWHGGTDLSWAQAVDHVPERPAEGGASIVGVKLFHENPDRASHVWEDLGGQVTRGDGGLVVVTWPDGPMDLVIERGPTGQVALLLHPATGAQPQPLAALGPVIMAPFSGSGEATS